MFTIDWFAQSLYRCRLEWGRQGARDAAARGDILVIVDTLRFSSAAITAVQHGVHLYPCLHPEDVAATAQRVGAEIGGYHSSDTIRYSLSPLSYLNATPGTRVAVPSPNGATCARYARQAPYLFVGALLNAASVAQAVSGLLQATDLCVSVIACGERWQTPCEDGDLRFAIEDYLGAGAILSYLPETKSPEAQLCASAFLGTKDSLQALLRDCGSGRELWDKGRGEDVTHAANLNLYHAVPVMREEHLELWSNI